MLPCAFKCFFAELFQIVSECLGNDLQKHSRTGGTAVIHLKFGNISPFVQGDRFRILPSDIKNRSTVWENRLRSPGKGLDLRYRGDIKVGFKEMSSVTCGEYPVKRGLGHEPLALLKRIMSCVRDEELRISSPSTVTSLMVLEPISIPAVFI